MTTMLRVVVTAVATKAAFMASMLYLVLSSGLTDFEKGLIIASVSAFITGAFTVLGAVLAARMAEKRVEPLAEQVEEIHSNIHDVARKVGSDKRETDQRRKETE